jgi:hypothetical protein
MDNLINKIKNLIYEKEHSITEIFCQDIIENFTKNNDLQIEKELSINKCILTNLNKNIQIYKNKINNRECYYKDIINPIIIKNVETIDFSIEKLTYNKAILNNNKVLHKRKDNEVLHYIWFLNECNCRLTFWNDRIIYPSVGKLIIFPTSWCFQYKIEFEDMNTECYIISGNICI